MQPWLPGENHDRPLPDDYPAAGLAQKRWELIRAAQGGGELPVRELARTVGRDVKRVHEDVVINAAQNSSHCPLFAVRE